MKMWMRLTAVVALLGAVSLSMSACCCFAPTKIATIEMVNVRYETNARDGREAFKWGPEPVRKIVMTPDQLLIFEKSRVQAVPLLDLKTLEWERQGSGMPPKE